MRFSALQGCCLLVFAGTEASAQTVVPPSSREPDPLIDASLATAIQKAQRDFEATKTSFRAAQGGQYNLSLDSATGALSIESGKASFSIKLTGFGRDREFSTVGAAKSYLSKDDRGWPQVKFERPTISERFVNEARGLHHWFQVNQRPAGATNLTLKLQVSGADSVRNSGENRIQVSDDGLNFQYSGLKVWDATGKKLDARLEALPERSQIALIVNDAKASYPLTIDPTWTQEAKLVSTDKAENDNLGLSVSLSGDRALVAAPYSDPDGTPFAGAAYIFTRASDGTWTQEAKLVAADKAEDDVFGCSVSLAGDRALVGARIFADEDTPYNWTGAAYVFSRGSDGTWTQEAKLVASTRRGDDNFGSAVSLSGDRALIGANMDSQSGWVYAGAAYIFSRSSNGIWTQEARLVSANRYDQEFFGASVSLSGDHALIGGSEFLPENGIYAGRAYVFSRGSNGTWTQTAQLVAGDMPDNPSFGHSLSLMGDRALIGAHYNVVSSDAVKAGSAYVFQRASNGTWTQHSKLVPNDRADGDLFGWSVSLSGDRALIGASSQLGVPGAAYVFSLGSDGTWSQVAKLVKADVPSFGNSVSLSGDRALFGAPDDDPDGTPDAGAAYVFSLQRSITVSFPTLYLYGGVPGFYGGTTRANAGTITLESPAPSGGLAVSLSAPGTTIATFVTVPAGARTATFNLAADRVASDTVVTVTASTTGYAQGSASLKVLANAVYGPSFPQKEVSSSSSITGTLKLVVPALTNFTATLTSSNPSALSVPSTVVVPAGASQVTFTATSGMVNSDAVVTVSAGPANEPSGVKVFSITVKPSRELASVAVSPIHYGRTGTGRVELVAPALVGGQVVALKLNRGNVTVPATVLVPGGETGANFTVTSTGTIATSATITATVGKTSKTATVTVVQPALASVTLTPASVVGGNSSSFKVTLTAAAPQGGVVVSLTASNGFALGLPSTVTIPEGQTVANVTVNTAAHTSATARTVTLKALVSGNRSVKSAVLTITRN